MSAYWAPSSGIEHADELEGVAVGVHHTDRHGVEIEHRPQGLAETLEEIADLQARAENRRQRRDRLQARAAAVLAAERAPCPARTGRFRSANLPARRDMSVRIDARSEAGHGEQADDAAARVDRHRDAPPDTGLEQPAGPIGLSGMCGSRSTVVDEEHATAEDRADRPTRPPRTANPGRIGRIAALEHRGPAARVLGKHGEGTTVVLEVVDGRPDRAERASVRAREVG